MFGSIQVHAPILWFFGLVLVERILDHLNPSSLYTLSSNDACLWEIEGKDESSTSSLHFIFHTRLVFVYQVVRLSFFVICVSIFFSIFFLTAGFVLELGAYKIKFLPLSKSCQKEVVDKILVSTRLILVFLEKVVQRRTETFKDHTKVTIECEIIV